MDIIGLLDKYAPWHDAPEGAHWRAMDASGQCCFFGLEPVPQGVEWLTDVEDDVFSFAYKIDAADLAGIDIEYWTLFIDKKGDL